MTNWICCFLKANFRMGKAKKTVCMGCCDALGFILQCMSRITQEKKENSKDVHTRALSENTLPSS